MEYMSGGTLAERIKKAIKEKTNFTEKQAAEIIYVKFNNFFN